MLLLCHCVDRFTTQRDHHCDTRRRGPFAWIFFLVLFMIMTMFLPPTTALAVGGRQITLRASAFLPSKLLSPSSKTTLCSSTFRLRPLITIRSAATDGAAEREFCQRDHHHHHPNMISRQPYYYSYGFHRRSYGSSASISTTGSSSSSSSSPRTTTSLSATPKSMVSSSSNTTLLEWETFEFSTAPKWDIRFDGEDNQNDSHNNNSKKKGKTTTNVNSRNKGNTTTMLHQQVSPEEWNQIVHDERDKDKALSRKLEQQHAALSAIDPTLVQRAIHVLSKVVQPERYQRIAHILQQRTRHVRFLFENPGNPSNVWACLRTLDSFGIQHVGIIMDPDFYEQGGGKAAIVQKRGMRTAMGSAQWMTVHHYLTTTQALQHVRDELGFCIVASDVHEGAYDIRTLPWSQLSLSKHKYSTATSASSPTTTNAASSSTTTTSADPPPICIVMGNEGKGISEEMRQACDATFYLPMSGFAESFNLSVATAVTCAHLSAASTTTVDGIVKPLLLQPGDLDPHEFRCLLLKGLLYSFAQKRTGHALLLNDGIVLPPEMNWI